MPGFQLNLKKKIIDNHFRLCYKSFLCLLFHCFSHPSVCTFMVWSGWDQFILQTGLCMVFVFFFMRIFCLLTLAQFFFFSVKLKIYSTDSPQVTNICLTYYSYLRTEAVWCHRKAAILPTHRMLPPTVRLTCWQSHITIWPVNPSEPIV